MLFHQGQWLSVQESFISIVTVAQGMGFWETTNPGYGIPI